MLSHKFLRNKKHYKTKKFLLISVIIFISICIITSFTVKKSINEAIFFQSKIIATNILSNCASRILSDTSIKYNEIVNTSRDNNGKINSIETDTSQINRIKAFLTQEITNEINTACETKFYLPLGTLIGSDIFVGRGIKIPFKIKPTGFLNSTIESQFKSAGINQTEHQLMLNLSVDITTIVPFKSANSQVCTNFIVAETVIVGEVPRYYTSIVSDDKEILNGLNNPALLNSEN